MYKNKKLIKALKKYSINKNVLVLSINDISRFIGINSIYNITYNSDALSAKKTINTYETTIFNNYFEHIQKDEHLKLLKKISKVSEQIIFDVIVSNYFCEEDHEGTKFYGKKYYEELINKAGLTIIEEIVYRSSLFEKHAIFIVRKR